MSERKRIVIVGGVAGGASAAARARRLDENAEIIMFERGEYISFANCGLPYHIGGAIPKRDSLLVQTPERMAWRFGIDVRVNTEVIKIDRQRKEVISRDKKSGSEQATPYDYLILSPGAEPIKPAIPGIDHPRVFTLRNIPDMDAIKKVVDNEQPQHAVVVGGGYIGLEMAEALHERKIRVTLVELADQVFNVIDREMATPLHRQLRLHGVDLRLGVSLTNITGEGNGLKLDLSDNQSINTALVIMAIGVRPETKLAENAGLNLGPRGGIAVNEHMQTNDPAIYAVGDAVEVKSFIAGLDSLIPLAGPANRQGRIAADNIFGRNSVYKNTQGTAICKVFDLSVGMVGLSEKLLKKQKIAYEKVYTHPQSHAGYYPGAAAIRLKLLFDPTDGKILGAQAVGSDGVDKRIDVLAVAQRAGMTVYELQDLELSYAPPYGSAKDPVNYAGFVASNALNGDVQLAHVDQLPPGKNQILLDVRTLPEVQTGTIEGAMVIPLDELRGRLDELPKGKELIVFCKVGLRGYIACRLLSQRGYRCRNLSGGYTTYQDFFDLAAAEPEAPASICGAPVCTHPAADSTQIKPDQTIDARGLQCPGPIVQLKNAVDSLQVGQAVSIIASDPGFPPDVAAWCQSTGNQLADIKPEQGAVRALIIKSEAKALSTNMQPLSKNKTIVVFSGDFDKVMAAFIIASGAAAMGSHVTLFFTFWGLNALRKDNPPPVSKNLIEKMFGFMMPRGARKLTLSKMNMGGMGLTMIKGIMNKKNVTPLEELIENARKSGVRLVACSMSMDLMGIKKDEMIDGVEEGGVALYLQNAEQGNVNLFI